MSALGRFAQRHFRFAAEAAELRRIERRLRQLREQGFTRFIVGCGYPKSGNTWLCRLLADALGCPARGYLSGDNPKDLAQDGEARESDVVVLKSHHSARVLARCDVDVVHVVRDPRDVAVSAAFYFFPQAPDKFERAVVKMTRPSERVGVDHKRASWSDHVSPFLDVPGTRYESLLADAGAELARLLMKLGFRPSAPRIARACEAQSFGNLRQRSDQRSPGFFRSGTAGQYPSHLNEDQIARIEVHAAPLMRRLGYPLAGVDGISRSPPAAGASPGSAPRPPA